jgi:hypothetical protein
MVQVAIKLVAPLCWILSFKSLCCWHNYTVYTYSTQLNNKEI